MYEAFLHSIDPAPRLGLRVSYALGNAQWGKCLKQSKMNTNGCSLLSKTSLLKPNFRFMLDRLFLSPTAHLWIQFHKPSAVFHPADSSRPRVFGYVSRRKWIDSLKDDPATILHAPLQAIFTKGQ